MKQSRALTHHLVTAAGALILAALGYGLYRITADLITVLLDDHLFGAWDRLIWASGVVADTVVLALFLVQAATVASRLNPGRSEGEPEQAADQQAD